MADQGLPPGWVTKESRSRPGYFYYYNAEKKWVGRARGAAPVRS